MHSFKLYPTRLDSISAESFFSFAEFKKGSALRVSKRLQEEMDETIGSGHRTVSN